MTLYRWLLIILFAGSLVMVSAGNFNGLVSELSQNENISSDSLFKTFGNLTWHEEPELLDSLLNDYHILNDTLSVPFIYYLPPGYQKAEKIPLLIYLHGGVSRTEFIDGYEESLWENPLLDLAVENNFLLLFPQGNIDTAWWSEAGMVNISYQIRYLKERYNIDDDRIYITGFSDGGSASYHLSMFLPDDFTAFYPLSGNMLVGTFSTGVPAYPSNMSNRYLRAVNTDLDGLYPADRMRLMIETAQNMGANILYLEYGGIGHTYEYGKDDLPLMIADMNRQIRNIFRPNISWETADLRWGKCDWLEITALDTLRAARDWHRHETLLLPDDRVLFGFNEAGDYEGTGVMVDRVSEGSAADEAGLSSGDIIIAMDNVKTETIEELLAVRDTKERGDEFILTVERDGETLSLEGSFPPVTYHEVFDYQEQSGALRAVYRANSFHIDSSNVSQLAIYIHPDMVNLDLPLQVYVNGIEVFHDKLEIDRRFMTANFLENKDRTALWVNRIVIDIP